MAFLYNNYQTRASSYYSSSTTAFDPEEYFQRHHPKKYNGRDERNQWKAKAEDEFTYHQRGPYECSLEPQQESIPRTLKDVRPETFGDNSNRIPYWSNQSWHAQPPSNDWNRKKLVPKRRIAPPRPFAGNDWNQVCRYESRQNSVWNNEMNEVPVPVRSPAWCDTYRKSAGQKRKRHWEEDYMQSDGHNSSWQSMKSFVMEDCRVRDSYEEDNSLRFSRYEESVYGNCTSTRMHSSEHYGTSSTRAKRQCVSRFQRDQDFHKIRSSAQNELNCSLDEVIPEQEESPKQIRDVPDRCMMYGSVPPARTHSSSSKLEMEPSGFGCAKSAVRGQRRPIIIDGANVAYGKTSGKYFDSNGISICVDWFLEKGFTDIVVVVSEYRMRKSGCDNPEPLRKLQKENKLVTCWSRKLPNGRWVSSYDDRMIVEIAHRRGGIIISNDRYRDLQEEKPEWAETIGTRVLGFRFMPGKMDEIMFPDDPFGRFGPRLEDFLRF